MHRLAFCVAAALSLSGPATAQVAQTYIYDANGRLISATTARTGANGAVSSYTLDDADNRTARTAIATTPPPVANKLVSPYILVPTQKLTSSNGQYTMTLEQSGDLVIAGPSGLVWHSCTGQGRSTYVRIAGDGRLSIYDPNFATLWASSNAASPGAELTLQDNGVAVLKSTGGATLWSSTTQCA